MKDRMSIDDAIKILKSENESTGDYINAKYSEARSVIISAVKNGYILVKESI